MTAVQLAVESPIKKILVIDDDELSRDLLTSNLEDEGYEALALTQQYGTEIERLVKDASGPGMFVICDNRLSPRGLAQFTGAEVAARLYEKKFAAMLLTQYQSPDFLSLRKLRGKLPVVVKREAFEIRNIPKYIERCVKEFQGTPVEERRRYRSLVRVEGVEGDGNDKHLVAFIPQWRPKHAITIPLQAIDSKLIECLRPGTRMYAKVNIGAESEEELLFEDFEIAADPDKDDDLR